MRIFRTLGKELSRAFLTAVCLLAIAGSLAYGATIATGMFGSSASHVWPMVCISGTCDATTGFYNNGTTGHVDLSSGSTQVMDWVAGIATFYGNEATAATGRAYNTGTASDTLAAGKASTFESANTSSGAFTVTIAAPSQDGEKREICFANATGTITWTVTTPATATVGLPTTATAGQCISMVYNSVAGTPTNSPATTWVRW